MDAGNASPASASQDVDPPANPFAQAAVTSSWQAQNSDAAVQSGSSILHVLAASPVSSAEPQQRSRPSISKDRSGARAPRSPAPRATIAVQPAIRNTDKYAAGSQPAAQALRAATCENNAASVNQPAGEATLPPRQLQHAQQHGRAGAQLLCPNPLKLVAATVPASQPMISPFALVTPAGSGQAIAAMLPAHIPCSSSALACKTPDLPHPHRTARALSASLESTLSLGHAQSNFRASSSDADFASMLVINDMAMVGQRKQAAFS